MKNIDHHEGHEQQEIRNNWFQTFVLFGAKFHNDQAEMETE
jgi:hypothetical protein